MNFALEFIMVVWSVLESILYVCIVVLFFHVDFKSISVASLF